MLKISHLQKHYRGFSLDCSMEVQPGMITGLIGRNGSGTVSYTHLRAHETGRNLVCRLLLEKKK